MALPALSGDRLPATGTHTVDFDLHGIVGVRLLDPRPSDVAAVARQLGPLQGQITGEPDITIRFVDRLHAPAGLNLLGLNDAAFTDDAFLVLSGTRSGRPLTQIAMETIGRGCQFTCETGVPAVPSLIAIMNLAALGKGVLPLHASAFEYGGTGVLVTGWSKGGKTEALLGFAANGARYIGDEWIYVDGRGRRVYGIPQPIRLWDWHLRDVPGYRCALTRAERIRLQVVRAAQRSAVRTGPAGARRSRLRAKVESLLTAQLHVDVPPERLFGDDLGSLMGPLDVVCLVLSHERPETSVEPIDPREIAERMVASLEYERMPFTARYQKFRFAFPALRCRLMDEAEDLQRSLLQSALAATPSYVVKHPYPAPIHDLYEAIRPLCDRHALAR